MSEAAVAQLQAVTHRYGKVTALEDVSASLPSGKLIGFIGPDGVGKSTLLGLLAGARRMQTGSVRVLEGDMRDRDHRQAVCGRIAYLPQGLGRNLYSTLSVMENVRFFAALFQLPPEESAWRIEEVLSRTGLAPFRDRPAGKLSGGMRQKLGLCCALIHDPDVLILDEPTTGVDPLSRRQFWELIGDIRSRSSALSVLVATAYMEEAEHFDTLVAMDAGRILAIATPAQLRERTATSSLEQAFIALLPEARRRGYRQWTLPARAAQAGDIAIEAQALTKRFGDFVAVEAVELAIARGEIFGFLGSNGCGKTTTMKMLTGLLPATSGTARLFGQPVHAGDREARRRIGYMSQSFSLYNELTVRQNLELHAKLFRVPLSRIAAVAERFGLTESLEQLPEALPLGMRQRLSLAVAVLHEPAILILDEPTSGVDPIARDQFWQFLGELSRRDGVTIFISTHFMNEAQRCDRISLMHAGRVLASGTPTELMRTRRCESLEEAFVSYLSEAAPTTSRLPVSRESQRSHPARPRPRRFDVRRLLAYSHRERLELQRDPVRLTLALLGTLLLMFIIGYGISMDVEDLEFAALDRDDSTVSREYILQMAGSRYFRERAPLQDYADLDRRMRSGEIAVAIEIPPSFGRDLEAGRGAQIAVWIDGAMPMRAETMLGYVQGLHYGYLAEQVQRRMGVDGARPLANVEVRYRYNPNVRSLDAMVPAVIPLLLIFIPAMLCALGVVREKELGSINNFYTTPVSKIEFLIGKQLPYIVLGLFNFAIMVAAAVTLFGVPLKGSIVPLGVAAVLYVTAATSLGLLVSAFTHSQIAAIFAASLATMIPAVQFAGLLTPVSSLEGAGRIIGEAYPTTHFLLISRGVFSKALGFADLEVQFFALLVTVPALLLACVALLKKQGA